MSADPTVRGFAIDFVENYDEASVIQELRRIATTTGKNTVSKKDIERFGHLSYAVVYRRFGSLRKALQAAELDVNRYMKGSDEELLSIVIDLWEKTLKEEGRRPFRSDLRKYGYHISGNTFLRRFGTWKKALLAAFNSITVDVEREADLVKVVDIDKRIARSTLSLRKRFFVLKRDHFACVKCGAAGYGVKLEVDHIVPYAEGGSDSLANLQTLCFGCNRGKRDSLE